MTIGDLINIFRYFQIFSANVADKVKLVSFLFLHIEIAFGELRHTQKNALSGHKKKTTSEFLDEEALLEACMTLGHGSEMRNLFQRFGANPRCKHALNLQSDTLPNHFCSLRNEDIVAWTVC